MKLNCQICGQRITLGDRVGRGEACPKCGADLKACRQCRFYAPNLSNSCREPKAERVVDKEKANFCDFYEPNRDGAVDVSDQAASRSQAEEMWEKMFGKKD